LFEDAQLFIPGKLVRLKSEFYSPFWLEGMFLTTNTVGLIMPPSPARIDGLSILSERNVFFPAMGLTVILSINGLCLIK